MSGWIVLLWVALHVTVGLFRGYSWGPYGRKVWQLRVLVVVDSLLTAYGLFSAAWLGNPSDPWGYGPAAIWTACLCLDRQFLRAELRKRSVADHERVDV